MIEYWCIGKTQSKESILLEADFIKRLNGFIKFSMSIVEQSKYKNDINLIKSDEATRIRAKIKPGDFIILLDEKGKSFTSREFASFNEKHLNSGMFKRIIYISGGAYGFDDEMYRLAHQTIKLSSMTFSHQLIRIIFLEQVYRAMTIIKNHPYHND